MEGAGQSPPATGLGPKTSSPKESAPPLPERDISSLSLKSESSDEDWLLKVCCPGARHRRCKNAKFLRQRARTETPQDDELAKDPPDTSYQIYARLPKRQSADLQWLMRLRSPKAQMEQQKSSQKQSFPAVSSSTSATLNKTRRDSPNAKGKPSESWLTQKHLSALQAVVSERQAVGDTKLQMERENCFVRTSCPFGFPVSLCVLLPPFHPSLESSYPMEESYFPSFLPPFPFSLVSVSQSTSPPMIVLPSVLLPPSVPPYFFHLLPPLPPYLHSSSLFCHSPFLQLSLSGLDAPAVLPFPPSPSPSPSPSPVLSPVPSQQVAEKPSQELAPPGMSLSQDFSAYHSHNPFFLPVPPPIQTHRRYQARQTNSDSAKYI